MKSNYFISSIVATLIVVLYLLSQNNLHYIAILLVAYILYFDKKNLFIIIILFMISFLYSYRIELIYINIFLIISISLKYFSLIKYEKEIDIIFGKRFFRRFFVEEKKFSELDLIFTIISFVLLFIM
jgi:hypothetical protein